MTSLIRLAIPIMLSNLLQMMYNLVDAWYLGKLGAAAVSAPSIAFNVVFLLSVFGMGFSMAGTTIVSHAHGAGNQRRADFGAAQTLSLVTILGFVAAAIGIVSVNPLLVGLHVPSEALAYTRSYMKIVLAGIPFMFFFFVLQSVLQGVGNSITPLLVQLVTIVLNILLDPLLIFGFGPIPRMEVAGAGIATVISRGVGTLIAVFILFRGRHGIRISVANLRLQRETVRNLIAIGLPTSLGSSISALGFTVLQGVVNSFGVAVVAAFGIGNRIISMFNMPAIGLSRAAASLVGKELGAENPDGARAVARVSIVAMLSFIIPSMAITFFFGHSLVRFFVDDPEVIRYGAMLFRIVSVSIIPFTLFNVIQGIFQGSGRTRPMMVVGIVRLWGLRVPLAFLLARTAGMGPSGIWIAMFVSNVVSALASFVLLARGRWLTPIR